MKGLETIWKIADTQHGVVGGAQLRQAGVDHRAVARMVAAGLLIRLSRRVCRVSGIAPTDVQRVMAAALDAGPGTFVCDESAAALWGVPGVGMAGPVRVARLRGTASTRSELAVVSTWRRLEPHHTTLVWGVPTLSLPVTLFRLGALMRWERFERIADTVCGRSPRVLDALHELLPELAASGRNGVNAMRQFLETRPPGYQGPHTNLEARVNQILRDAGERPLEHQVDLGGHSWIGRVDLLDREVPFVLEVNGDAFHGMPTQIVHDRDRAGRLEAAGLGPVIPIPESDVWQRPWRLVEVVRGARRGSSCDSGSQIRPSGCRI